MGILGIVASFHPVGTNFLEEKVNDSVQRFGHDALMPPVLAHTIADLHAIYTVIHMTDGNRADGLAKVFQHDGPLIIVFFAVMADPVRKYSVGYFLASVGGPREIFGHSWVRGPVAVHGLGILQSEAAQNQPGCLDGFGSKMVHKISSKIQNGAEPKLCAMQYTYPNSYRAKNAGAKLPL